MTRLRMYTTYFNNRISLSVGGHRKSVKRVENRKNVNLVKCDFRNLYDKINLFAIYDPLAGANCLSSSNNNRSMRQDSILNSYHIEMEYK